MNDLKHRKRELHRLEDRFKNVIESDSDLLENNIKSAVKVGAIVGVSLLVAYKTYKLIAPKKTSNKKVKESKKYTGGLGYSVRQRLYAAAATLLYQEFKKRFQQGQEMIEESLHPESKS